MTAIATFASGCFWCTEAVFLNVRGVDKVTSGYTGGSIENPSYEQVCSGRTGHAEAVQIEFDPGVISYEKLTEIFFLTHNPTTLNRQGHDVGTQYRSAIFYHDEEQKKIAELVKEQLTKEEIYPDPIVTTIEPFTIFYPAEAYHQNYFARNPDQPYCQAVINPKISHLRQQFQSLLKS